MSDVVILQSDPQFATVIGGGSAEAVVLPGTGEMGPQGPTGATGSGTATVADRTALAAVSSPVNGESRILVESGRVGLFKFNSADLSAFVTADTAQGVYVAPSAAPTGASGAWVRQFSGPLVFDWFGAVPGDFATGVSADCLPAWNAMMSYIEATRRNVSASFQAAGPEILFPGNQYFFNGLLEVVKQVRLRGMSTGQSDEATWLRFPADSGGILVTDDVNHTGYGSLIEGFTIQGGGGSVTGTLTTDLLKSGIRLLQRATIRDCFVRNFAGAGICISADISDPGDFNGNANVWRVDTVRAESNLSGGMFVSGGDANAGVAVAVDAMNNGRFGIFDSAFLSNMYVGCHSDSNGGPNSEDIYNLVYDSGFFYNAKVGATHAQLIAAAPASNANWIQGSAAGGPAASAPQWSATPTVTYAPGGAYGATNGFATFDGCYYETGQGPPQIAGLTVGGFMSATVINGPWIVSDTYGLRSQCGFVTYEENSGDVKVKLGGVWDGTYKTILGWNCPTATGGFNPDLWFGIEVEEATGDLLYAGANASGTAASGGLSNIFRLTSSSTARQYGTGTTQGHVAEVHHLALGDANNARIQTSGTAAPTTGAHAQGEIVWNTAPAAGGTLGWVCVTAGTPGTWKAVSGIAA